MKSTNPPPRCPETQVDGPDEAAKPALIPAHAQPVVDHSCRDTVFDENGLQIDSEVVAVDGQTFAEIEPVRLLALHTGIELQLDAAA